MANEKSMDKPKLSPELSSAEIKAARKAARERERFEKKELKRLKREHERRSAILSPEKRPIICPPDRSGAASKHVVIGLILRIIIILTAVIGVSLFVSEAFGYDMTAESITRGSIEDYLGVLAGADLSFIAPWALLFVAALSLCALRRYGALIGVPVILGALLIRILPDPVAHIREATLTAYNAALGHMKYMGFFAIDMNQLPLTQTAGTPEELVRTTVILLTLLTALVFVPFLIKRTRISVPAVYSAAWMVLIFTYNLSRSNMALALMAISFCGLIVMHIYDRIYIAPPKPNETDETGNFFGSDEEPPLTEHLIKKMSAKSSKEAERAKRASTRKRKETVTLDREISDYFAESKPARAKKPRQTREMRLEARRAKAEARALKREQRQEDRRALRARRSYRDNILLRRISLGGFAGAGVMLISIIVIALPAMLTTGSFRTIPAIDEKLEYYREYVTAVLMGDDPALDLLAFEGDASSFSPRTTLATPRYYTYEPMMTVESNYSGNIYLRGWIATDYNKGLWTTADPKSETLASYRALFAVNDDASESIYHNFFNIMTDDGVFEDGKDVTDSLKRLEKYGYTIAQVNIRREEDFDDLILYMPSFHIRKYCPYGTSSRGSVTNYLRAYGSSEGGEISYANYFDGLYTSYRASKKGSEGYAAVAMIATMRQDSFRYNIANLIAEYNQTRLTVANGRETLEVNAEDDRLGRFAVTLYDGSRLEYEVLSVAEDGTKQLAIKQEVGTALYTIAADGSVSREMLDTPAQYDEFGELIIYYAPKLEHAIIYFEALDPTEQWQFDRQATLLDKYTPFVYNTYTGKAGSSIISDTYADILSASDIKTENGETAAEYFSIASQASAYKYNKKNESYLLTSAVTDREVYLRRHELVMEMIDYLCDEERFTYTLYPAAPPEGNELDGVETFLTLTHEGYCVQFASSLALLLREAGIPARYVEGYIASGMYNHRGDDAVSRYKTTVLDSDAHAWVEVWYDGIGWIQYEATPKYYDAMYVSRTSQGGTVRPSTPSDTPDPGEEEPSELPGLTDEEIAAMLEEQRREALRALIGRIVLIFAIVLTVAACIAIFFAIILKRAKKRRLERDAILRELYEADERQEKLPERAKVRMVGDMIMDILRESGFAPEDGEFSAAFAARIAEKLKRELTVAAPEEGLNEFDAPRYPINEAEMIMIFDAIAAEEFGNGAPARALPSLAKLYYRLRATVYRTNINALRRAVLYLFK